MLSPDRQRLEHMREYCVAISKTIDRYGNSFENYVADPDFQRSICFSIFQVGELSGGLSAEFRQETNSQMPWAAMKAMRNLVVHNYGKVDHAMVWETATSDIPALLHFCDEQLEKGN